MSATDTAKELVRIATTAGISKDVIDLMEKKLILLTGEVADLLGKNTVLSAKVAKLEIENSQLRAQTKQPQAGAFQENMGVLWKRTARGYEPNPYCKHCPSHPIMVDHAMTVWACDGGHYAPYSVQPPGS